MTDLMRSSLGYDAKNQHLNIKSVFYLNEMFDAYPNYSVIISPYTGFGKCEVVDASGFIVSSGESVELSTAVIGAVQAAFMLDSKSSLLNDKKQSSVQN